jgi:energy-coupling factor transport system permease protein
MIRDITIGQYYPEYSIIHKLDPRTKILLTFAYIMSLFIIKDFVGYIVIATCLCVVIAMSKVPVKFIVKGLKPILVILSFTFLMNMFMTPGHIIVRLGFIKLTEEGVYNALFMTLRLVMLIMGSSVLTLTTKPMKLTDGIESLLKPFERFRLPAHEIAMMMTIALRFIPTLLDETDKIMKAQQARGADFETGNILRRVRNMIPLIIPLFVGAFRIAMELAMAMESRCYRGGEGRTKLSPLVYRRRDFISVVIAICYIGLLVLQRNFATFADIMQMLK